MDDGREVERVALRRRTPRGRELFPGFTDVEEIGVGSLAVVYRAREIATNRFVALKLLNVRDASPRSIESFERESIALGALSSHPNIVTLYRNFRTSDGRPVLVLELCSGAVSDRLRGGSGLPVTDVVAIGIKIAGALETAHRSGILHRDVKPQNILVTDFGEPALADFGVAMLQSSTQTTAGLFDFTTLHAAPELLEGGGTSAATDVYELASSLYQLIAGESAFRAYEGESPASVILRILRDPVRPLLAAGVPVALSDLLIRAMSKEKAARPPTAAEFAAELAGVEIAQRWNRTQFLIRGTGGVAGSTPQITRLPDAVPRGLASGLGEIPAARPPEPRVPEPRPSEPRPSVPHPTAAPVRATRADPRTPSPGGWSVPTIVTPSRPAAPPPPPGRRPSAPQPARWEPRPAAPPPPRDLPRPPQRSWEPSRAVPPRPPVRPDDPSATTPPDARRASPPTGPVPVRREAPPAAAPAARLPPEQVAPTDWSTFAPPPQPSTPERPSAAGGPSAPEQPAAPRDVPTVPPRPAVGSRAVPATGPTRDRRERVGIDDEFFPAQRPRDPAGPRAGDQVPQAGAFLSGPIPVREPTSGDTSAVPMWALRQPPPSGLLPPGAAGHDGGPSFRGDTSVDPSTLPPRTVLRSGRSSVTIDERGVKVRSWFSVTRLGWGEIQGFETHLHALEETSQTSGHLVVRTVRGPTELPASRRRSVELRYLHATLEAYRSRYGRPTGR